MQWLQHEAQAIAAIQGSHAQHGPATSIHAARILCIDSNHIQSFRDIILVVTIDHLVLLCSRFDLSTLALWKGHSKIASTLRDRGITPDMRKCCLRHARLRLAGPVGY